MNKQVLILLAATVATTAFCTIDERLLTAQPKRNVACPRYSYITSVVKGAATAAVLTPVTGGGYSLCAGFKFGNLIVKKLRAKNVTTQDKLEQHAQIEQLINWGSQALISTPLALALWGMFGQNCVTRARDVALGIVLKRMNPFELSDIEQSWELDCPENLVDLWSSAGFSVASIHADRSNSCVLSDGEKRHGAPEIVPQGSVSQDIGDSSQQKSSYLKELQKLSQLFEQQASDPSVPEHVRRHAQDVLSNPHALSCLAQYRASNDQQQDRSPSPHLNAASSDKAKEEEKEKEAQESTDIAIRGFDGQEYVIDGQLSPLDQFQRDTLKECNQKVNDPHVSWIERQCAQQMIDNPCLREQMASHMYLAFKTDPEGALEMMQQGAARMREMGLSVEMPSEDEIKASFIEAQQKFQQNRQRDSAESNKKADVKPQEPAGPPQFPVKQDWQSKKDVSNASGYQYSPTHEWSDVTAPYNRQAQGEQNGDVDNPIIPKKVMVDNGHVTIECCDQE